MSGVAHTARHIDLTGHHQLSKSGMRFRSNAINDPIMEGTGYVNLLFVFRARLEFFSRGKPVFSTQ